MSQFIRTTCDWENGTNEDGTVDPNCSAEPGPCEAAYNSDRFERIADEWLSIGEMDYCPKHARFICQSCGNACMEVYACPNAKDWCLDCCGEDH